MDESILTSVKKMLGITDEYDAFDMALIMHINSVFMILYQLGVGPEKAFRIEDESSFWSDFISTDDPNFESVKSYMYLKVRLLFDPPTSSVLMEATKQLVSELEWRLNFESETTGQNDTTY